MIENIEQVSYLMMVVGFVMKMAKQNLILT